MSRKKKSVVLRSKLMKEKREILLEGKRKKKVLSLASPAATTPATSTTVEPVANITSAKKRKLILKCSEDVADVADSDSILIKISDFVKIVKSVVCSNCFGHLDSVIAPNGNGIDKTVAVVCRDCAFEVSTKKDPVKKEGKFDFYDQSLQLVYSGMCQGMGHRAVSGLSASLGLRTMTPTVYNRYKHYVVDAVTEKAKNFLDESVQKIRDHYRTKLNRLPDENYVLDIDVSNDG